MELFAAASQPLLRKLDHASYSKEEDIAKPKFKSLGFVLMMQTIPRSVMRQSTAQVLVADNMGIQLLEMESQQSKQSVCCGLVDYPSKAEKQQRMARGRHMKAEQLKVVLDWLDQRGGTQLNFDSYASLLRHCADAKALPEGKRLHAHITRSRFSNNRVLGNLLLRMYGVCGSVADARAVFDRITEPNGFSRSMIITAYSRNGLIDDARDVFDNMLQRDVISWNTMIAAYSQNGRAKEALQLFGQMDLEGVKPDKITFISAIDACASVAALGQCKGIHARIVDSGLETDMVVANTLVNMYGKCGSPEGAWSVFEKMPQRDVVSWNTMIAAFVQNGRENDALDLFQRMGVEGVNPDKITYISVLDACTTLKALVHGQTIHASIIAMEFETDVVVGTALVNMYGRCGCLDNARRVFDNIQGRDTVAWTALISAYTQNGHGNKALELFRQMDMEGVKPDKVAFIRIIDACASLAALTEGRGIHASIAECGLDTDVIVATALLNMYGKCGSVDEARYLFDIMPCRVLVSWNAMIAAYAQNGRCMEALKLFECMNQEGVKPDRVTFVSVLFSCSHAGLLDDGWQLFVSMSRDHSIIPTAEHYACMIDLIGRAGRLDEAEDFIKHMSVRPDAVAWISFLGACKTHADLERGAWAAKHVFELGLKKASPYVLLSNIYAAVGRQDDAAKVRQAMEDRGVIEHPGHSL